MARSARWPVCSGPHASRPMTLVVDHLSKRFGTVVALDDLAFEVAPGQVFGFLGANGAGKTTTMRIALGVLEPDAGRITWRGTESHRLPRSTWGYLPEERGLYPRMRCWTSSCSSPASRASPRTARGATRLAWLRRFRAEDLADRRAEQLSKGNQQKIQFIAAVLHDPQVLLMDEPFTGLDPVNVMLLREAFLELRDRGRTVVFSTHQMEVAEALCESVAIVDRGRMVVGGHAARGPARHGAADGADLGRGRPPAAVARGGARARGSSRSAWTARPSSSSPGVEPDVVLAAAVRRRRAGHALRARRSDPRAGVHRLRRPARRRGDAPRCRRTSGPRPDAAGEPRRRTRRSPSSQRGRGVSADDGQHRARRAPRVRRARRSPAPSCSRRCCSSGSPSSSR